MKIAWFMLAVVAVCGAAYLGRYAVSGIAISRGSHIGPRSLEELLSVAIGK